LVKLEGEDFDTVVKKEKKLVSKMLNDSNLIFATLNQMIFTLLILEQVTDNRTPFFCSPFHHI